MTPVETITTDVVVVGSGAAALTAALAARKRKAHVVLLEKSPFIGGTTAMSGGLVWVPNNRHMRDEGHADSFDEAFRYIRRLTGGRRSDADVRTVIEAGPAMIDFLEASTEIRFETLDKPDYHPEFDGAKACGRCLAPLPLVGSLLGDWFDRLRPASGFGVPLSWRELDQMNGVFHPERFDLALMEERSEAGFVGMGRALAGWLLKACVDGDVDIRLGTRAHALLTEPSGVAGVEAVTGEGATLRVMATRGTILAGGGFEWNEDLVSQFVAGPVSHPLSCPTNEGDTLTMGRAIGADLANMWDLWRFPTAAIPGEEYGGRPLSRMVAGERSLPGTMMVNHNAKRFVNEAHPYTDVGRVFMTWDPVESDYENYPAWSIFDRDFRETYSVLSLMPGDDDPAWLTRADSLDELARKLDIHPQTLTDTVARFNQMVDDGHDRDFRRGDSLFDRYYADFGREPSPTLGRIQRPPFYALTVYPGAIGSSGGLLTDGHGRVRHVDGTTIPNLFAAGDAAASCFGPAYGGPGGPLAHGMTVGYLAGSTAAGTD
jgi:succinate dehydrogenase/fumarate reductase flavoprotein subunit